MLKNKNAVVYGAAGAVGSAVARAFARAGATVFLSGRDPAKVRAVADDINRAGGVAEAAEVDALDEGTVEKHLDHVVGTASRVDISFNAIGIPQQGIQGIPLAELSIDSFALPITTYARSHFVTARAAARRMVPQRSGVILLHTPEPARIGATLVGGMGPAWAALEGLTRSLSAELGPSGVRVVCVRSTGILETHTIDVVFAAHAQGMGITREQFQSVMQGMIHTRRFTTLAELGNVAVFLASDMASGMTGTVANLTGGEVVD